MLFLKILLNGSHLRDVRVEDGDAVIGRDTDCDIVLPDPRVSRRQALIRKAGDDYFLETPEGRGGLKHNGDEIKHDSPPVPIHPGDLIEVGGFSIEVASWTPGGDDASFYVSVQQAARELQVAESDLAALLDEGLLKSRQLRGRRVIESGSIRSARASLQARNTRLMKPQPGTAEGLETTARAASVLGAPPEAINEMIAEGRIRAFRDRGDVLINVDEAARAMSCAESSDQAAGMNPSPAARQGGSCGSNLVLTSELAAVLGMPAAAVEDLLRSHGMELLSGSDGNRADRARIAALFAKSSTASTLMEDAMRQTGDHTPCPEVEEDPTDDTQEDLPQSSGAVLRGSASVKHFSVMNPSRTYPLVVKASRLSDTVLAVPRIPGCVCVPAAAELTPEATSAEFWLTPVSRGMVPGAAIEFIHRGRKTSEARIPCMIRGLGFPWAMFCAAGLFLVLALLLDSAGLKFQEGSFVADAASVAGGIAPLCLLLSGASFIAGAAWLAFCSPRESQGVTVSISAQPEHKSSPNA